MLPLCFSDPYSAYCGISNPVLPVHVYQQSLVDQYRINSVIESDRQKINDTEAHPKIRQIALEQWIKIKRDQGLQPISLGALNLSGINLREIDFSETVLSIDNFYAILAGGGSLCGARLARDVDKDSLPLHNLVSDNVVANFLVDSGVDFKSVLFHYLATPHAPASQLYKADLLNRYLDAERKAGHTSIDLSSCDLSDVIFTDSDFNGALFGTNNLAWLFAGNANLFGARLIEGTRAPPLHCLDFVKLDKTIALQLVEAGADSKAVFLNYRATQRKLENATDAMRELEEFGLAEVVDEATGLTYIAKQGAVLNDVNIQAQFEHEFLALLKAYVIIVGELVKHSSTRDYSIRKTTPQQFWPDHVYQIENHDYVVLHVQQVPHNYTDYVTRALRFATGDCGEMALLGKSILNAFLQLSLEQLGWKVDWQADFFGARFPSRHYVDKVGCQLKNQTLTYLFDPWSKQVWPYDEGVQFFRANIQDGFTHSDTRFKEQSKFNEVLNQPDYQEEMRAVFAKFGIEQHITQGLQREKYHF